MTNTQAYAQPGVDCTDTQIRDLIRDYAEAISEGLSYHCGDDHRQEQWLEDFVNSRIVSQADQRYDSVINQILWDFESK